MGGGDTGGWGWGYGGEGGPGTRFRILGGKFPEAHDVVTASMRRRIDVICPQGF